jgi:predicted lysophospholipase L1 biosynthesis ABC-type transport system permease subunit
MVEGRDFTGTPADSSSMMLNQAAVKTMGLKKPLGMKMRHGGRDFIITGITGNVVMASPYQPVDPMIIFYRPNRSSVVSVRLSNGVSPHKTISSLEKIFTKYNPSFPFEYRFVDIEFARKFITEELIGKLTNLFAGLAIFICCLGMAGLASFTIEKRVREISVRKILGASIGQLLTLIATEFMKLVAIAFAVAVPLTWWAMNSWLQNYQYRISVQVWIFGIVGVLVMLLTLAIVWFNIAGIALANPAKKLRNE